MSDLKTRQVEKEVNNIKYILKFDMNSIDVFQESYGKGIIVSLNDLLQYKDDAIVAFLTSCIRHEDEPDKVLGNAVFEETDLLDLIFACTDDLIKIIIDSLPKKKESTK